MCKSLYDERGAKVVGICRDLEDKTKSGDCYCLKTISSQNDNGEAAELLTVNFGQSSDTVQFGFRLSFTAASAR